jgi:hypothetical protein
MVHAPVLEQIPIAGFCWSLELGARQTDIPALIAHHHRMMESLSPSSSVAALATAMMPRPQTLEASSSSSLSSSSSNGNIGPSTKSTQILGDMFPVEGPNVAMRHAFVFSMNDELERLLGYSREGTFRPPAAASSWIVTV